MGGGGPGGSENHIDRIHMRVDLGVLKKLQVKAHVGLGLRNKIDKAVKRCGE